MKKPSMLEQLTRTPIERPCNEPWDAMHGDARVRHCTSCARDVYDLSAMSPREAEIRLLNAAETTPCIRYVRRHDGTIAHLPEPREPEAFARSAAPPRFAAAAALGVTLGASALQAKEPAKTAPAQCVPYLKQSDVDGVVVAAVRPAPSSVGAAAAPPASPPAAAAPAAAPPAAAPPQAPPQPQPLGGAPPPMREQPTYGTLSVKSKLARDVTVIGIKLHAPISGYLLTPGDFVAEVREPDGKTRVVKFRITQNKTTVVDLDKK